MWAALSAGFGDAVRRTALVVMLWQVNLLFGAVFAGLAATALAVTLDGSSYTRTLLYDLDALALFALAAHHLATFKLLGAMAATLMVLYVAAWVLLHGAIVASVCGDDELGVRDALRAGAGVLPPYLRIGAVAALVFAALVGSALLAAFIAMKFAREAAAPSAWEAAIAGGVALGSAAWVFCAAVHDHARIRCFLTGEGALQSYAWALRFVLRGGRRAFPLAAVLGVVAVALAGFYQLVAASMSADWMTGVVLSILWGQAMLLARCLFRVWGFAAAAHLQEPAERRDAWS